MSELTATKKGGVSGGKRGEMKTESVREREILQLAWKEPQRTTNNSKPTGGTSFPPFPLTSQDKRTREERRREQVDKTRRHRNTLIPGESRETERGRKKKSSSRRSYTTPVGTRGTVPTKKRINVNVPRNAAKHPSTHGPRFTKVEDDEGKREEGEMRQELSRACALQETP